MLAPSRKDFIETFVEETVRPLIDEFPAVVQSKLQDSASRSTWLNVQDGNRIARNLAFADTSLQPEHQCLTVSLDDPLILGIQWLKSGSI